jgi:hypothetical protein
MRRLPVALAVAIACALASAPAGGAAAISSCGSVSHTVPGTGGHGHAALNGLLAVHVSCHEAHRVASEYLAGAFPGSGRMSEQRPVGWHHTVRTVTKRVHGTPTNVTEVVLSHGAERVVGNLAN